MNKKTTLKKIVDFFAGMHGIKNVECIQTIKLMVIDSNDGSNVKVNVRMIDDEYNEVK